MQLHSRLGAVLSGRVRGVEKRSPSSISKSRLQFLSRRPLVVCTQVAFLCCAAYPHPRNSVMEQLGILDAAVSGSSQPRCEHGQGCRREAALA